jgi:DNA-binding transcriptional ArsR family regulator
MSMDSCSCCTPNSNTTQQIAKLGPLIKVIGEDSRLRILCALQCDSHCVCELEEHTKLSQSLISHHLKDLKSTKMVSDTKKGQKVYYSLTDFGSNVMKSLLAIKA